VVWSPSRQEGRERVGEFYTLYTCQHAAYHLKVVVHGTGGVGGVCGVVVGSVRGVVRGAWCNSPFFFSFATVATATSCRPACPACRAGGSEEPRRAVCSSGTGAAARVGAVAEAPTRMRRRQL